MMTAGRLRALRWFAALSRRIQALVVVLVLAAGTVIAIAATAGSGPAIRTTAQGIPVSDGPGDDQRIRLDTSFYRPERPGPFPAVILAHGFGGSKDEVADQARRLARSGYAVLTFSARGFGRSTGRIELDSPDYEVKDVRRLIDWLARRPDVIKDRKGDPRVGITGASYGGAVALLTAAADSRIDAIVPTATWNDLSGVFFRQSAPGSGPGVFAQAWAGLFFGSQARPGQPCGRLATAVCAAYQDSIRTGAASPRTLQLLRKSSPAGVLDEIGAPTLLIQGQRDSLFGLDQADANARGIAAAGTPVHLAWYTGGHDAGSALEETPRLRELTTEWFDHWLRHDGPLPGQRFTFSKNDPDPGAPQPITTVLGTEKLTGLGGTDTTSVALRGPAQPVSNPVGGEPRAVSSVPGAGPVADRLTSDVPGQFARFVSAPLPRALDIVGAGRVRVSVRSSTSTATLFVKLYDVDPDGERVLPAGLVAPVRLEGLSPGRSRTVAIRLPAIVHDIPNGHRLALVVASTDQAYAGPLQPATYQIEVSGSLVLPLVPAGVLDGPSATWPWVVAALAILLAGCAALVLCGRRRRARRAGTDAPPIAVDGLRKAYGHGLVAVDDVTFRVEREQILGLLGPNGAGKTTTLRILLGLIAPSAGQIRLFGEPIRPGAPVLSRVGALVEGPGLLPHLSGKDNLRLYWRATGQPAATAHFEEVLRIAGLGTAIDRKVRTYSHGMKQRLAIAQAMLGLPDLLVLDEPTNGLDPPQIRELRTALQQYALNGRTVVISSHLLAEVELTCTHVVVMDRGRFAASGTVAEIIGAGDRLLIETDDPDRSAHVLTGLPGVQVVERLGQEVVAALDGTGPGEVTAALVAAGLQVRKVAPRRRLEDAFVSLVGEEPR